MRRALVIGVDDYRQAPLTGCVKDADAIASLLSIHGSGSPNFDVRLLASPPASVTRRRIREAINELFAADCEIALLYFSGHGFVRSGDGCIVTKDAETYDEGMSMTEILGLANNSSATNRLVMLDCCYSGNMGTPPTTGSRAAELGEGLTVLAASRAAELAMEDADGGIFTSLVIAALMGGAADLRGHITPASIYAYVDQALGAWDQRPIFKSNVTRFPSIRDIEPRVPLNTLRKLVSYFRAPDADHALDPTYEHTHANHDVDKTRIFKDLQRMQSVGLVVPVGEDHMYDAAINSKSCQLTALGAHYWRLGNRGKL